MTVKSGGWSFGERMRRCNLSCEKDDVETLSNEACGF